MRRLIAICMWLAIAGCNSSSVAATPTPTVDRSPAGSAVAVAGGCGKTQVYRGGEPDWLTRAGDHNNPAGLPYFITDPPIAAGFVFGYPLRSGTPATPSNKILWVVDRPRDGNDLVVAGHPLNASTPTTKASFPDNSGPGAIYPSEVDVPSPGCWHFDLTWGPNHTSAELVFV